MNLFNQFIIGCVIIILFLMLGFVIVMAAPIPKHPHPHRGDAETRRVKRHSQTNSRTVTDKPEQTLFCAAREVSLRKCPALFSRRAIWTVNPVLS